MNTLRPEAWLRIAVHAHFTGAQREMRTPAGASPAEPTLEDAYLLMLGPDAVRVRAPA